MIIWYLWNNKNWQKWQKKNIKTKIRSEHNCINNVPNFNLIEKFYFTMRRSRKKRAKIIVAKKWAKHCIYSQSPHITPFPKLFTDSLIENLSIYQSIDFPSNSWIDDCWRATLIGPRQKICQINWISRHFPGMETFGLETSHLIIFEIHTSFNL